MKSEESESLLKILKELDICVHHGTCDCCHGSNVLVCHFGYTRQKNKNPDDVRVCPVCAGRCMFAFSKPNLFNGMAGRGRI